MGRQVTACLVDLVAAGCTVRNESEPVDDNVVHHWVVVAFPDGREFASDLDDCLVFDCRNRNSGNYWVMEQLIDLGVPFRWA